MSARGPAEQLGDRKAEPGLSGGEGVPTPTKLVSPPVPQSSWKEFLLS